MTRLWAILVFTMERRTVTEVCMVCIIRSHVKLLREKNGKFKCCAFVAPRPSPRRA